MDRVKPCSLCGLKIGEFVCPACGALVCGGCFVKEKNMCRVCASKGNPF